MRLVVCQTVAGTSPKVPGLHSTAYAASRAEILRASRRSAVGERKRANVLTLLRSTPPVPAVPLLPGGPSSCLPNE
jgi:hypothetical protein